MQYTSQLYKDLLSAAHTKQAKLRCGNASFASGSGSLRSLSSNLTFFPDTLPSVGGVCLRELRARIFPGDAEIPRGAELRPALRLAGQNASSEWIGKGVFYIERRFPAGSDALDIVAFDRLYMQGADYPVSSLSFPAPDYDVLNEICAWMGVAQDARTALIVRKGYMVPSPVGKTVGDVLSGIAASYAGNFIMSDAGELLLVPIWALPEVSGTLVDEQGNNVTLGDTNITVTTGRGDIPGWDASVVNSHVLKLTLPPAFAPWSGVELQTGESTRDLTFTAGDTSGSVLKVACEWATQAMANDILEKIQGLRYQPYQASNAQVEPAAETGDAVVIGHAVVGLYNQALRFSAGATSDIGAPGEREVTSEFPYQSPSVRRFTRETKALRSELTIAEDRFASQISQLTDAGVSMQTLIDQTVEALRLEAKKRAEDDTELSAALNLQADEIAAKLSATDGTQSGSFGWNITLTNGFLIFSNGRTVFSVDPLGNGYFAGEVIAESGNIGGCSIVNGVLQVGSANIQELDASKITVGTLSVDRLEAGSISDAKLSQGVQLDLSHAAGLYNSFESESGSARSYGKFNALLVLSPSIGMKQYRPIQADQILANPSRYYVLAYDRMFGG